MMPARRATWRAPLPAAVDNGPIARRHPQDERMRVDDPTDPDWYLDHVVVPGGPQRRMVGRVLGWQGMWSALAHRLATEAGDPQVAAATRLALGQGFVLTHAQARDAGLSDAAVRRLLRRKQWSSCGRSCLTVASPGWLALEAGSAEDRARREHALRAAAAVLRRCNHVVATASAAILHGLPVMAVPQRPELFALRPTTSGRLDAAHVRLTTVRACEVASWFGAPLIEPARTVVDLARFDARSGLMAADAALHEALVSHDDLAAAIAASAGRHGLVRAREVLALASARIESPLESVTHLALHDAGFPPPELQFEVRGANGRRYFADFAWPALRLILEADGRTKYRDGELWAEKGREVFLARAGYRIARVRWYDVLHDWPATSAWLRELMASVPLL
jgi:hypothetical protein